MADIKKMLEYYRQMGYSDRNADARVCQDIVLKAICPCYDIGTKESSVSET
ncbi:hypothetical protein SAMN06297422_11234 [Lachnospiraceae bacterium]|nr:hypothetical protein SAMN06297422_11234 [Lachnospiraceae bacterium]